MVSLPSGRPRAGGEAGRPGLHHLHLGLHRAPRASVEHGAWSTYCLDVMRESATSGRQDRVAAVRPVSFDASLEQILAALATGAQLVITARVCVDARELLDELRTSGTRADPARGVLEAAVRERPQTPDCCRPATAGGLGGEAAEPPSLQQWPRRRPAAARLLNVYGPDRDHDHCRLRRRSTARRAVVPIGRPIANTALYVLDQPAPGAGGCHGRAVHRRGRLARGYLNRPELTAEKFVPTRSGPTRARMYRTGDLVRVTVRRRARVSGPHRSPGQDPRLPDRARRDRSGAGAAPGRRRGRGGRPRGHRPATSAGRLPRARRARGSPPPASCAPPARRLPDYMVPGRFVFLDALPLTPSGKVDRKALPDRTATAPIWGSRSPRRAPWSRRRSPIWSDPRRRPIGVHDNFFALGGHSLLAIRLVDHLGALFDVQLSVRAVFESPTPARLARALVTGGDHDAFKPVYTIRESAAAASRCSASTRAAASPGSTAD